MLKPCWFAASIILATILIADTSAAQNVSEASTSKPTDKKNSPPIDAGQSSATIIGAWRADSIKITKDAETNETKSIRDNPASVIITEKNLTLRMSKKVISETEYVLDKKQSPWHFDLKSPDGVMHGICKLEKSRLEIMLNDGDVRPADFDKSTSNMKLILKRFLIQSIFVIDADGKNLHKVITVPEFTKFGSPQFSPDGSRIAWDGWQSVMGATNSDAHVMLVNSDGSNFRDLDAGAMPSFSPDGKQIVYCQYAQTHGVSIMAVDGTAHKLIDGGGWGARWSNKSNEIAYVTYDNAGANICVNDVSKGEKRTLLDKTYSQVYWGSAWSPDDKWICFQGVLPDGKSEVAAVSVEGEKKGFKVVLPITKPAITFFNCTMSWGGPDNEILAVMRTKADAHFRLYLLDFAGAKPPRLFPNIPAKWIPYDVAWSRDGKKAVFSATPNN